MKAMNFNEEIPAFPNNLFKNHYVLVFDLTSLQDAGENIHYPELNGKSIRLERPVRSDVFRMPCKKRDRINCSRRKNVHC